MHDDQCGDEIRHTGSCRHGNAFPRHHDAPVPDHAKGIPAATVSFRATLTATSNRYLAPRLPVTGLVQMGERDIYGNPIRVVFMPDPEPGQATSFVSVPDAAFSFESRV